MKTALALPLAALLAACGGSSSSDGNARLSLLLTDAPASFKAAVVTITEIDLVGSGGKLVLSDKKTTTNLLTLANDAATLVKDAVVPPGTYTELRFVISGGYVQVDEGSGSVIYASSPSYEGLPAGATVNGTLKMPSLSQSGLKIDLPSDALVVKAESKVLLIDFDVAQSFGHEAGNSGSWVMHPVIKGADFTLSGNLNVTAKLGAGVTLPPLASATSTLADFSAVVTNSGGSAKSLKLAASAPGSATYAAAFKYLLPGSYSVTLAPPAGMSATSTPASPVAATIASGQDAQVDFTVTSASVP